MATNHSFRRVNGRETLEQDGIPQLWQCPECKWWWHWEDTRCTLCGNLRNGEHHAGSENEPPNPNVP